MGRERRSKRVISREREQSITRKDQVDLEQDTTNSRITTHRPFGAENDVLTPDPLPSLVQSYSCR